MGFLDLLELEERGQFVNDVYLAIAFAVVHGNQDIDHVSCIFEEFLVSKVKQKS